MVPYTATMTLLSLLLSMASLVGAALLGWAAYLMVRRSRASDPALSSDAPAISLLKPLHGAEPHLRENLGTALDQPAYPAAIEMLCGVARMDDPAVETVEQLTSSPHPVSLRLIVDARQWGTNAKVSNLTNIAAEARHKMIVLADSDMAVPPHYFERLAGALAQPGVGAVTCLYVGRGDAGFWSRLVAAGIDTHFIAATEIGLATGLGHPCMGSTIALRRETLDAIGGFAAFADVLADDHAIGAAVRATRQKVAVPAMVLTHGCAETRFGALLRQELRWNATIAGIDPFGYAGSFILHPLPLAILACLFRANMLSLVAIIGALAARAAVALGASTLDPAKRGLRARLALIALIPLRDLLSFGLFIASFAVRSVDWRGRAITLGPNGRLTAKDPS
jgi:ceramide glucosyltransferase